MQSWWLSSLKMTVYVDVEDEIIQDGSPIVRKFFGQPLNNLKRWMSRQGGLRIEKMLNTEGD